MNILFEQKELFRNLRCEITVDKKNNKNVINNNSKYSKIIKEIEYYINVFFPKQLKKLTNMSDISSSVQEFVSEISISFLSINNIEQPSVSQIENAIEAIINHIPSTGVTRTVTSIDAIRRIMDI